MATREPFAIGEWYHCYSRGVDKRKIFLNKRDYERFMLSLYVGNSHSKIHPSDKQNKSFHESLARIIIKDPLVEIGSYCLMPNHFHILIREITEGGIALFMQKVLTGYTMYFNKKNKRNGSLFSGTFHSRHIEDDRYLKKIVSYIHINPVGKFLTSTRSISFLQAYDYSSLKDFMGEERIERKILCDSIFEIFDSMPSISEMIQDAAVYQEQEIVKV